MVAVRTESRTLMPTIDRRALLRGFGALGVAAGATAVGASGTSGAATLPRPMAAQAPQMTVLVDRPGAARGRIYYTSAGAVIADQHGTTIDYWPSENLCADFRPQSYRGRRVLTWHEQLPEEFGNGGTDYIGDRSFRILDRLSDVGGLLPDLHEFRMTARGTAFLTAYQEIPYDLSPVGGPVRGTLHDSLWLEVDIASKAVLRQWRASDHIALAESYLAPPDGESFDFFHINSVSSDVDGNILISARHTSAVYKLDGRTGEILWRMGGKRSDFTVEGDAAFRGQHDARACDERTIRLFDNGSDGTTTQHPYSRVLWLRRDERKRSVRVVRELAHPHGVLAEAMGNAHELPNGNTFVGWGSSSRLSEFDPAGRLVFDATLPNLCYRGYRVRA